ncbi:YopX family protein [Lacticaseibacillus paracasei]|uniref:YopX family protein n=1 Tax=Lacticaseibacillus paracasei TaxID=1597 RepID=UPI00403FA72F
MKREIKFRAYSSHNHKIYSVSNIEWDIDGRIWVTADDGKNGIELIDEEAHLMQYTGLHDKNGREIYEGDIVHAYDQEPDRDEPDYRGSEATGIVEFHGSMFMLDDDIVLDYPPILEVIGNIFENTEMLEEEQ